MPERKLYSVQWLDERWRVTHRQLALSVHWGKPDAVAAAVRVAEVNQPSAVRIYREDGALEDEKLYGADAIRSTRGRPTV